MVIICFPKDMGEVLNWIHSELVDHHSVLLAVCDNGTFFPGFGWRLTRVLFERKFCSMKRNISEQQKDWKDWSCSKMSTLSIRPKLWGWQLQVQSIWEANQYYIAYVMFKEPFCWKIRIMCCFTAWVRPCISLEPFLISDSFANGVVVGVVN